ncbi:MAG: hypothetical protein NC337_16120 [Roseburia sp.]|nr:hypothetical protein [Roseburia sp.]
MKMMSPDAAHKISAIDFINEFYTYGIDTANVPNAKVPSLTYFYVREADNKIVGMGD